MNLRDVPIKRKLTFVIMLTSSVVLLLASVAFISYELITFRKTLLQHSQTIAQIIAANSTAPLTFEDEKVGTEILSKLHAEPTILTASLYDRTGKMLARYPAEQRLADFPAHPGEEGHRFESSTLTIFSAVRENESQLGTLFIKTDLTPVYNRLQLYGGIVAVVMVGSLLIALALSNWLQKRISEPIMELAETAKAVSLKKDYLVRARKMGSDELGLLTDAFNQMLTEIHQRDVALRESEERLRLALDASQTGTWDWNMKTGLIRWDHYLYRLFGLSPGEFDGQFETFLSFIHPDDRAAVSRQIKRSSDFRTEFMAEFRAIWPDQTVHYLGSRGRAFYDDSGKAVRMSGVTFDLTESREAAEARSLLVAIVESSDDAIIGKNLSGKIVSWNAGAERMFGYSAAEAVGQSTDFLVPAERLQEEQRALTRIQTGRIEHYESVRRRKDGSEFFVSLTMSPIKNADGKIIGASAISRDITDRIRAEEQIRTLNTELEQRVLTRTAELAATNHELEAFTYSVSHDLRAPLRHIDAFAQILDEEAQETLSEKGRRYLERIRNGVKNMGQLVDDLLNLSRVGRMEIVKKHIRLNAILDEVLSDLKPEIENRKIEWRIAELPSVEGDPGLIKQVFTNLISNAIKYTRPRETALIQIDKSVAKGETAIFVRDNGVGFNMKYAGKLFGVFQRLHRMEDFEGTGVGLATVQRIVQLHGGRVWAEAQLDKGATFYFTLQGIQDSKL